MDIKDLIWLLILLMATFIIVKMTNGYTLSEENTRIFKACATTKIVELFDGTKINCSIKLDK